LRQIAKTDGIENFALQHISRDATVGPLPITSIPVKSYSIDRQIIEGAVPPLNSAKGK
jgi:hypothetical protein